MRTRRILGPLARLAPVHLSLAAAIALTPAGATAQELRGKVVTAEGIGIPYGRISICGNGHCTSAVTNRDGFFRADSVPPGQYTVEVPGRSGTVRRPLTVTGDSNLKVLQAD
ncbi:carboxypeptidase-like regulatory domain-containing protein [Acuticoccus sediminis]|uniref:carboxypeptidase-like regulatory domain-containing protein n=1 Tax=Acuticoccus sediminis TaxID=2184697 RepID=UPI001CFD9305|nr:carboxypeptidase-like regulatory domain-containing protein [Acuticoccus sediminis]